MKKRLFSILAISLLSAASLAFATTPPMTATKPMMPLKPAKQVQSQAQTQQQTVVKLYAEPNESAKVLDQVDVSQRLIPIFRKGGWIKVGDPRNGQVGWMNKDQYQKAMNTAFHQNVQMLFVEVKQQGKKGKPQVVAYKNGQKLSKEQAQKLYKKIQKRQSKLNKQMKRYQKRMNQMFQQDMQAMDANFFALPPMPMMQPIVIIEQGTDKLQKAKK